MLSVLGICLFVLVIGVIAWVLNQVVFKIMDKFGYLDEKPHKPGFIQRKLDNIYLWYVKEVEK